MMNPSSDPEVAHVGRCEYRIAQNPREGAILSKWKEQQSLSHTLEWLLCASPDQNNQERGITQEEATCAATLMQWLGSPVGFAFLEDALDGAGYRIVPKEKRG